MLIKKILYLCCATFFIVCGVLGFVFLLCSIFFKALVTVGIFDCIYFLILLIPSILQLIFPLAVSLSCYLVIMYYYRQGAFVLFAFLEKAKKAFFLAIIVLSCIITAIYFLFIFEITPRAQIATKQFLYSLIQKQTAYFEQKKIHTLFNDSIFFFEEKNTIENGFIILQNVFFVYKNNETINYCSAVKGLLHNNILTLYQGNTCLFFNNAMPYIATFAQMTLNFNALITKIGEIIPNRERLFTLHDFLIHKPYTFTIWFELYKRIAYCLWIFLMPFIIWFAAFYFGDFSFVRGIFYSGGLFLFFYIAMLVGQLQKIPFILAMFIFFLIGPSILLLFIVLCKKNKQ